jgi:DNA-binding transcriptional ArsR family regulator
MTAENDFGNRQAILEALQHPLRRELLKLLIKRQEMAPIEASRLLDDSISNVSYHMRTLADRGVVSLDHVEQARGAAVHFYVPNPAVEQLPWVREAIGLPPSRQS